MFPTLFDSSWIGLDGIVDFRIPSYTAAILVGFALAAWLAYRDAMRWGVDRSKFIDFAIWMLIVGVLGSRIMHVLVDGFFMDYVHLCTDPFLIEGKALESGEACISNAQCLALQDQGRDIGGICNPSDGLCYPQQDCFRWLKFWAGGLTVYGGLIGCVLFGWWYMKKNDLPVRKIMDLGGYGMPLGLAIGRLGCLAAGCCFGSVCDIDGLGIRFPVGTAAYQEHFEHFHTALDEQWRQGIRASLPVWPTQLVSSIYNFGIFCVAYFVVRPRKKYHGQVLLTSVFLYAACRFGIEFFRADPRGGIGPLATSQIIALATTMVAGWMLWRMRSPRSETS